MDRRGGVSAERVWMCGEGDELRVAYVGPHYGEEPPISGEKGSGTVFFTGCHLRCSFCQNYQISHEGTGRQVSCEDLAREIEEMICAAEVHNLNFVTPDHFLPHVLHTLSLLCDRGQNLPCVFNVSGYQSQELLEAACDSVDIYLPDYKYSDPRLAAYLSRCGNYPKIALEAISKMVRQKGFLDACLNDKKIAKRGVLVRHLILSGHVENSINALTMLFLEFGRKLPLSLMSQYQPVVPQRIPELNRRVYPEEFERVYEHVLSLGFEHLFVQFPGEDEGEKGLARPPFVPDFKKKAPFDP